MNIIRPKYIIFNGYTHWSNTWLGRMVLLYNPQKAANGWYSHQYKHWKNIVLPFVASAYKVGGEKIKVKIEIKM